jgi:adenylate cyclase
LHEAALELDPRFGFVAALAGNYHSTNVILGYAADPHFERKEAIRLVRLALSIDDGDPEILARAAVTLAFMVGDGESEIEMANRAARSTPIHIWYGSAEVTFIELRGCRRKRSAALNGPCALAR